MKTLPMKPALPGRGLVPADLGTEGSAFKFRPQTVCFLLRVEKCLA